MEKRGTLLPKALAHLLHPLRELEKEEPWVEAGTHLQKRHLKLKNPKGQEIEVVSGIAHQTWNEKLHASLLPEEEIDRVIEIQRSHR